MNDDRGMQQWQEVGQWEQEQEQNRMSVYQKLSAARTKFHSLTLKKTGENKFAGYKYFELGDFLIPALDVFAEHDLCAIISFTADTATMRIVDMTDNSEIVITSPMGSAALKGCHEVQNIGAVETYQRRYLWVAALEIVEHDALDATTGRDAPVKTREFTVADSIRVINSAKDVDALNAYWKVEVAKYPATSADYKTLKEAAAARKAKLQGVPA